MPDSGQNVGDLKSVNTFDTHWLLRHTRTHFLPGCSGTQTQAHVRHTMQSNPLEPVNIRNDIGEMPVLHRLDDMRFKDFFGTLRDPECLNFSFRRECAGPFCYPNILDALTRVLIFCAFALSILWVAGMV